MKELQPNIGAHLYKNKKVFSQEIVYEITTQADGLPFGIAIADIEQSVPHFHEVTTETYIGVQGSLEVTLGSETHTLNPGDTLQVKPGVVHSARSLGSDPARITVISMPEWSAEDHHLAS